MDAEEKIFRAFYEQMEMQMYFNQLKESTRLSNSSLQNALNKLIENKTLKVNKTKSNTFYVINDRKIAALKFAEISISKFRDLNRGVRMPLSEFLKKIPSDTFSVVLFGSASRKEEQEGSDMDLLVVSANKVNLDRIKKETDSISNHPLNLFYCSVSQFMKSADHIIIQAKKTGFPVMGQQNFYEAVI